MQNLTNKLTFLANLCMTSSCLLYHIFFNLFLFVFVLVFGLSNHSPISWMGGSIVLVYKDQSWSTYNIVHPESFRSNAQIAIAHTSIAMMFACVYLHSRAFAFAFVCEYCSRSTACAWGTVEMAAPTWASAPFYRMASFL